MKHKLKMGGILALALFLVYLYGCQKEELEIEQPIPTKGIPFKVEVPQVESYFVAESSKGKVIDKLFKALGYATRTGGNVTESYETGIGTILTDEILAVQDVFGTKYTFKLDHPEKDFYTFFNLVMVDKGEEVVVLLKKYIMTEEFANLYRSDQKTVDDFNGSVATTLLTNPCLCEFPNEGEPEIVYPGDYTPGGSGGGGTVAGSGPSGPSGPGSSSGGSVGGGTGGTTHCFLISFTMTHTITYTNGNSHTKTKRYTLDTCTGIITVNNKGTKASKDGNNQTETYNENGCCSFGAIGIMDDNNTNHEENCKKLKDLSKPEKQDINSSIQTLKNKVIQNVTDEWGVEFVKNGNTYSNTLVQGQGNQVALNTTNQHLGGAHLHTNNGYGIFSWGDLWFLNEAYIHAPLALQKDVAFLLVVKNPADLANPNVYAIKVDDSVKLSQMLNNDLNNSNLSNYNTLNKKIDKIHDKLAQEYEQNKANLEHYFLTKFKEYGISTYKATNNLDQWFKLEPMILPNGNKYVNNKPCL